MKRILFAALIATACGYTSRDNELVGQAKKVVRNTPLVCPDWSVADISLGVMQNGVGSMSSQDVWLTVEDRHLFATLKTAVETGAIVKVRYDVRRVTFCIEDHVVTAVEILGAQPPTRSAP